MPRETPKIRVVGDPVLHTPSRPVTSFDDDLALLIDDMFAALAKAEGVGLAAPQIGVDLAVFVYDCPDGSGNRQVGHVVNPTIRTSGEPDLADEGCLSVPGPYHELARASRATVHGVDKTGAPVEVSGTDYFARCLQHETDHLKGVLYIDHLPRNRRRRILREMEPFDWNDTGS
jgi:peptide deformylase